MGEASTTLVIELIIVDNLLCIMQSFFIGASFVGTESLD